MSGKRSYFTGILIFKSDRVVVAVVTTITSLLFPGLYCSIIYLILMMSSTSTGQQSSESTGKAVDNSAALVLYDESVIPSHHRSEKLFQFSDLVIRIKQNWSRDGLAGVVWDAVSCMPMKAIRQSFILRLYQT